ncbi:MAG: RNA polymerase sigma factor WhiG [Myxococcales bacterium]
MPAANALMSQDAEVTSRNELVGRYAPVVRFVASKIAQRLPPSVELDDLISAGIIGLLDAIDKYDATKSDNFKRYAEIRIRGAILDELRSLDWVSRSVRRQSSKLDSIEKSMKQKLGRAPSDEEMADVMGLDAEGYRELLNRLKPVLVVSFEDLGTGSDGEKRSFDDFIKDPRAVNPQAHTYFVMVRRILTEIIEKLPEKQRIVISLYYFDDMNLKEIGKVLDVTESRVSQLHSQAMKTLNLRLKKRLDETDLRSIEDEE